jgi:starch synthase
VGEKAADVLPGALHKAIQTYGTKASYMILGSGEPAVEAGLTNLADSNDHIVKVSLGYNESLSHGLYAAADFLLMPSRVEPCGLNQLYAMRYGTIPVVRRTGGLNDTVLDIGDGGYGICFNQASVLDIVYSIGRAIELFKHQKTISNIRQKMMTINNSWNKSAAEYIELYYSIYR